MSINASPARIVLVEDDADVARSTRRVLSSLRDVVIDTCMDVSSARRALMSPFDVVVSDFNLPDGTGVDVLRAASDASSDALAIVITGEQQWAAATSAINDGGAYRVLGKPVPPEVLTATVRDALTRKRTRDLLASERAAALPLANDRERLLRALGRAIDRRLQCEAVRADSLAHIGRMMAEHLGLSVAEQSKIELAILAHRIGSVALRDDESAALIPVLGSEILRAAGFSQEIADAVCDTGETATSLTARILAIATRYLERTGSVRSTHDDACALLVRDDSLDPDLVATFVAMSGDTWSSAATKTIPFRPIMQTTTP
jgi:DNA-binding response OmpR family regulator